MYVIPKKKVKVMEAVTLCHQPKATVARAVAQVRAGARASTLDEAVWPWAMAELSEAAPPGFSGTVRAMKDKGMPAKKAFALAWAMYKKGARSHVKPDESALHEAARLSYVCPKCGSDEAYTRQAHEDTSMEETECRCPKCRHSGAPETFAKKEWDDGLSEVDSRLARLGLRRSGDGLRDFTMAVFGVDIPALSGPEWADHHLNKNGWNPE